MSASGHFPENLIVIIAIIWSLYIYSESITFVVENFVTSKTLLVAQKVNF